MITVNNNNSPTCSSAAASTVIQPQQQYNQQTISMSNGDLQQGKADALNGLNPMSFAKWRGHNLQDPSGLDGVEQDSGFGDCTPKTTLEKPLSISLLKNQGFDVDPEPSVVVVARAAVQHEESLCKHSIPEPLSPSHVKLIETQPGPQFFEVTFEKGWASRLGIQLEEDKSGRDPKACVVKQIVPNTIASADGRVKVGFKLLQVNDFDLRDKEAKYVIDLLRKMKGKICMKFLIQ